MNGFGIAAHRINSLIFLTTTFKLPEKFDHPFLHLFIFGNIFAQGHDFVAVTVTFLKYLVSLHKSDMEKF